MIERVNELISEGKPCFVSKAIQPTFDWNIVVNHLAYCADNGYGEPIGILNYKLVGAGDIPQIKIVLEYLNENLSKTVIGADLITTLKSTDDSIVYSGKNDVLIWNVIGFSNLVIKDGDSRDLEPGDLIFIPKETEYIVKPESPRAFVLFSLEQ